MNIEPVNYSFARRKRLSPECGQAHPDGSECSTGVYKQGHSDRGYNVNFSGGLPEKSGAAAKSFMGKIMNNRAFEWLTGFAGEHPVATGSLVGLFLAGGLRPLLTLSLPGKDDREDKIYAAGHSLSSAIIGFGFSTLITTPIDSGIKYIYNDAKKMRKEDYDKLTPEEIVNYAKRNNAIPDEIVNKNLTPKEIVDYAKENNKELIPLRKLTKNLGIVSEKVDEINGLRHQLNSVKDAAERGRIFENIRNLEKIIKGIDSSMHNITEWVIAIPRASLTIALIPYVLKYVFHLEKKPKLQPVQQTQQQSPFVKDSADSFKNRIMGGGK